MVWGSWSTCNYNVTGDVIKRSRECKHISEGIIHPSNCGEVADANEQEVCPGKVYDFQVEILCLAGICPSYSIDFKYCPEQKPHVFNKGKSCCKVYYQSNIGGVCDGGFLALEDPLECCPGDEHQDCDNEPGYCQDHSIARSKMHV